MFHVAPFPAEELEDQDKLFLWLTYVPDLAAYITLTRRWCAGAT